LFKNKVSGLGQENDRISEVRAVCDASDVVIAVMGLDSGLEGEEGDQGNEFASGDKPNLELPGLQETILKEISASGKPAVLVILSGSALAFPWAEEHIPAIVQAWYPGAQGGRAVAQMLFGEYAPEGKLPVTFYRTTEELPAFTDYAMKGRTYRYMTNEALYPFGYGLSYTDFAVQDVTLSSTEIAKGGNITVKATVANNGTYDGAETVQVYVKAKNVADAPNFQLKGLKKVTVPAGKCVEVELTLTDAAFGLYDADANFMLNAGEYEVFVGSCQPDTRSIALTGKKPASFAVTCKKTGKI
jgi:beta-glucosidase